MGQGRTEAWAGYGLPMRHCGPLGPTDIPLSVGRVCCENRPTPLSAKSVIEIVDMALAKMSQCFILDYVIF